MDDMMKIAAVVVGPWLCISVGYFFAILLEQKDMAKKSDRESTVQREAMLAIGQRPDALIWRQQSGYFRSIDDPQRIVKVGTVGISDSLAVVSVEVTPEMVGKKIGVAVGIEFKAENGRQSAAQRRWQTELEKRGGIYRIIRSKEDATRLVDEVKGSISD